MARFDAFHATHGAKLAGACGWKPEDSRAFARYAYALAVWDARVRAGGAVRDLGRVHGARLRMSASAYAAYAEQIRQANEPSTRAFTSRKRALMQRVDESRCISLSALRNYEVEGYQCVRGKQEVEALYRDGFIEGCMINAPESQRAECREEAEKSLRGVPPEAP